MRSSPRFIATVGLALALGGCGSSPSSETPTDAGATPAHQKADRRALWDANPSDARFGSRTVPQAASLQPAIVPAFDGSARFAAKVSGGRAFFTEEGISFTSSGSRRAGRKLVSVPRSTIRCEFEGARRIAPSPGRPMTALARSLQGAADVRLPTFGRVAWEEAYPGVDVIAEPQASGLEYRFVVSPHADVRSIALRWSGANAVELADDGRTLLLETAQGRMRVSDLHAFEIDGDRRHELTARHELARQDDGATLDRVVVEGWSGSKPLIIDPSITWSTYLGGTGGDGITAVSTDGAGNVFVAGVTNALDFPTKGASIPTPTSGDNLLFVSKLTPAGSLVWSTYVGPLVGGPTAVLPDSSGNVVVVGHTTSATYPTQAAIKSAPQKQDLVVTSLTSDGALRWSTYFGGSDDESSGGASVDAAGNVTLVGEALSNDFPLKAAWSSTRVGASDGFVARLSPSGALLFSTYFGGNGADGIYAHGFDASGNLLIGGATSSTDLATTGGADRSYGGGSIDGFAAKLGPTGSRLWATYLGGADPDAVLDGEVTAAGEFIVGGITSSAEFSTYTGVLNSGIGSLQGIFVAWIDPSGSFFGPAILSSGKDDTLTSLVIDDLGSTYITGYTTGVGLATVNPVRSFPASYDAIVAKFGPTGVRGFVSYLGGSGDDYGNAIAVTPSRAIVIGGTTNSTDFPSKNAYQPAMADGADAFLVSIAQNGLGWPCSNGAECGSGLCVEKVCCDSACDGSCTSCLASKKGSGSNGTCGPIAAGAVPRGTCPFVSFCGADGTCDGAGACRTAVPAGKVCGAAACSGGVATSARACDGTGTCAPATAHACAPYLCAGTGCSTGCSLDVDCDPTAHCISGACVAKHANGGGCATAADCVSSYCVDGVCCDAPCSKTCEACSAARKGSGADGACGPIGAGLDPDDECKGDACTMGSVEAHVCDGAGACTVHATSCGDPGCDASGTKCRAACSVDSDCPAGKYCDPTGNCQPPKLRGEACSARRECDAALFCVDGVCCDAACNGQCQACDVRGAEGTCTTVLGAPHGTRSGCAGSGSSCAGTCDGKEALACTYPGAVTTCGTCVEGAQATCDGHGACTGTVACGTPAPTPGPKSDAPSSGGCSASSSAGTEPRAYVALLAALAILAARRARRSRAG